MSAVRKLEVVDRPVTSLKPYEKNARLHPKGQIKKLVRSLERFGFVNPILIDADGNVICGHGRLEAAKELGMTSVPTITLEDMSEADRRAYILADNKLAQQSSWSKDMLKTELQGLVEIGYDVELTGFDTLEIDTLLCIDDAADPDDVVNLPADDKSDPVCRLGDLWHLGDHRLLIGDSRDPASYERLLEGQRAQLVLTDPPYGCPIENNVSGLGKVKHQNFLVGAGETSLPEFAQTLLRPVFKEIAKHASSGAIAFVFCDWRAAPHLLDAAQGVFDEAKNLIVWSKTNAGMGSFYRSAHELIYAFRVSPWDPLESTCRHASLSIL